MTPKKLPFTQKFNLTKFYLFIYTYIFSMFRKLSIGKWYIVFTIVFNVTKNGHNVTEKKKIYLILSAIELLIV